MAVTPIPVRTCVGCRRRAPATELLRVVERDGGLVPDPTRRLPGRGASVHPTPECLRAAVRRRAFPRALRVSAPLETHLLQDHVDALPPGGAGTGPAQCAPAAPLGPATGRSVRREQDDLG